MASPYRKSSKTVIPNRGQLTLDRQIRQSGDWSARQMEFVHSTADRNEGGRSRIVSAVPCSRLLARVSVSVWFSPRHFLPRPVRLATPAAGGIQGIDCRYLHPPRTTVHHLPDR